MKISNFSRTILAIVASCSLSACAQNLSGPFEPGKNETPAQILPDTMTSAAVRNLPAPSREVTVAVYEFPDLTGQNKPNPNFAEYSRAVTQGADAILVDVLSGAGHGKWFNVVERRGLSNVLRERQLIQATRQQFQGEAAEPLPAMTFAGVLIEGGVVSYESNLRTGGVGARYLGIGGNTQYQEDFVTVNLRLVAVNSGRVILSVTSTKQIYSTLVQASVFRYVSTDSLLEVDAGYTRNSPPQFALREAIELGVFALIMEGNDKGVWRFSKPAASSDAMKLYKQRSGDAVQQTVAVESASLTSEVEAQEILAGYQVEVTPQEYGLSLQPETAEEYKSLSTWASSEPRNYSFHALNRTPKEARTTSVGHFEVELASSLEGLEI